MNEDFRSFKIPSYDRLLNPNYHIIASSMSIITQIVIKTHNGNIISH